MALQGLNTAACNRISHGALVSFSSSLFSPYHSSRKKEIPVSQLLRGTLPLRGTKPLFSPCRVSSSPKLGSQQDFADTEAARFRQGLSRMLQEKAELGEIRTQHRW